MQLADGHIALFAGNGVYVGPFAGNGVDHHVLAVPQGGDPLGTGAGAFVHFGSAIAFVNGIQGHRAVIAGVAFIDVTPGAIFTADAIIRAGGAQVENLGALFQGAQHVFVLAILAAGGIRAHPHAVVVDGEDINHFFAAFLF